VCVKNEKKMRSQDISFLSIIVDAALVAKNNNDDNIIYIHKYLFAALQTHSYYILVSICYIPTNPDKIINIIICNIFC